MDISKITEYLSLSSKVTKKNVDEVLELDPRLVISMIVQWYRRLIKGLAAK
jgi:hypothetical protein